MLLAGDIGGTKTTLAIYTPESGPHTQVAEATLPSARYASLEDLVKDFLGTVTLPSPVDTACFGVAGPVVAGRARITNLPWVMDEAHLRDALGISSVRLLNDLDALAHAIPILQPDALYTLNEGEPDPAGALAVIAPGTGLGEAFLTRDGSRYYTHASEGGHADFAPSTRLELDLLSYLLDRFDHVSYERVCSGHGLPNIYAYLRDSGYAVESPALAAELAASSDHTPVIVNAALAAREDNGTDAVRDLCVATVHTFVSILGAQAGNLALTMMATGGVYLGGGIPPRILPLLTRDRFMTAFQNKGRFAELLNRIPVYVILNPKAALLGAADCGLESLAGDNHMPLPWFPALSASPHHAAIWRSGCLELRRDRPARPEQLSAFRSCERGVETHRSAWLLLWTGWPRRGVPRELWRTGSRD